MANVQYLAGWGSTASKAVNVSSAAPANTVAYYAVIFDSPASGVSLNSVSGLGGTWTSKSTSSPYFKIFRGTGCSGTGNVTGTLSSATGCVAAVWFVPDTTADAIAMATNNTTGTSLTGPSQNAGLGQQVLGLAVSFGTMGTFPTSSPTPATGWTSATVSPYAGAINRSPAGSAEAHQFGLTSGSGGNHSAIGQIVVGSISSTTVTLAGTLQAKTAAFTVATVLGATLAGVMPAKTASFAVTVVPTPTLSLAGTLQAKTAAFTLDAVPPPVRDVTLAGELAPKAAAFTVLGGATSTLAGDLQPKTAAFSLMGNATVSLAGTVQAKTAAFTLASGPGLTLSGSLRRKTSVITLSGHPVLRLAATRSAKTATFTASTVPTVILEATLQAKIATFATYAVTPVTPAPPSVVTERAVVVAQAFGAVTMVGTQPVYSISEASTPRARQQIVVDGVDVTYFRDVVTPDVTYTLLEPLLYGPGQLDLPQVSACFERPGTGALTWLRPGAPVEVHRVIDDVVVGTDYKGVVVAFDLSGRNLSVELGGEASGRAALRNRQPVIFPRVNDIGHQISDAVRDLGLPHWPALGTVTGIEVMTTGGTGHLEHIQNLVAKAWTVSGGHWTVMPDEATGVYETHQKDETTVHATAFCDDAKTVANLRRDISEEPNRIYPTAVSPQGERIRGAVYPDLNQGPVPPFPGHMQNGDTGDGVRLLVGKLHATNYLRLYEVVGDYDTDVVEAVKDLQEDAGLPKTGEVNEATWNALYDLTVTTPSLISAHVEPFVQRGVVRQKNRSASGTVVGFNDNYDPAVLKVDRNIDMEVGLNRSQVRRFSRAVLHDSNDANWVGDVVFNTGALLRGDIAVGATVTEGTVMDARELRPGMNVRLRVLGTSVVVHVVACDVKDVVTATVDTRFRDAMEVWEILARNKESRNDPARRRNRDARSSTIAKDSIGEWDAVGGELGHDVHLDAGWNVFEVVGAAEGTISRLRIELGSVAEFACAVFGRRVDRGFMEDVIGPPLTEQGEKNWRRATPRARLRDEWLLYSAGTETEPCGYGSDLKSDGAALTGIHRDEAGFAYRSESRTLLYVAVWVPAENTIPLGRIMWPQLEAGV